MTKQSLTDEIIRIGKLLWDKGLVTGFNGNISVRMDVDTLLITATGTCLGYLKPQDILTMRVFGEVVGEGKASTEKLMHTAIYKNFLDAQVVVHTHPTYTIGHFLSNDTFEPKTFEAKFYLGQVEALPQTTPSVTDIAPLMAAIKKNNIVVLKNHGVVATGPDLFHAFVLIQELEEQVKMDLVDAHYAKPTRGHVPEGAVSPSRLPSKKTFENESTPGAITDREATKKYKLFSKEQIDEIVRLVNNDTQMQELGSKTVMNMDLAVCLQETGDTYSFKFQNGRIIETGKDTNAEFLITANENIWRAVFNREIDPFVATTQKKMNLRGDFARISKWYAPCSRIFQLWAQVPVE